MKNGIIFSIGAMNAIIIVVIAIGLMALYQGNQNNENFFSEKLVQKAVDGAIVGFYTDNAATSLGNGLFGAPSTTPGFQECVASSRYNLDPQGTTPTSQSPLDTKEYCGVFDE